MTAPAALEVARFMGDDFYITGKPCKHGHFSKRYVIDSSCVECRDVATVTWRREHNRVQAAKKRQAMLAADPEGTRAAWAAWQREHRKKFPEMFRARERKHGRIKRQRYPERILADVRKRQAAKLKRTPKWADLTAIRAFYEARPKGLVIDHIVPLRGRTVSGLHVLNNLQYLTEADNLAKNNLFDDWAGV